LKVAFEEILAHFADFRLDGPVRYTSGLGQGLISLPMVFARAAR